jgi:hypothetical protein
VNYQKQAEPRRGFRVEYSFNNSQVELALY